MKLSNETKVGILTTVTITIFIFGYNYLRGKDLFTETRQFHAVYTDIDGLVHANDVMLSGFVVGQVDNIHMDPKTFDIYVSFTINTDVNIPTNTVAKIVNKDLFGTKAIGLELGSSAELASSGDTLLSKMDKSFNALVSEVLNPLVDKITKLTSTIDTAVQQLVNGELNEAIANVNSMTRNVSYKLNKGLDTLNSILSNTDALITNLRTNEGAIQEAIANFRDISDTLSTLEITKTMTEINQTLAKVNEIVTKINDGEGSLGLLVNNEELYRDLDKATKDLDALILKLKNTPMDVNIHLFGGKKNRNQNSPTN